MKKTFLSSKFLAFVVLSVMILTTSITFGYWKSGLEGNKKSNEIQMAIGAGEAVTSEVTLSASSNAAGKQLVPSGKVVDSATQVTSVTFTYNLTWTWDKSLDPTNAFEDYQGILTVTCDSIEVVGTPGENLVNAKGAGSNKLFVVTLPASQTIEHNSAYGSVAPNTVITITVKLNEPANREQYEKIAGQNIKFKFTFNVESPDDLNQE